MRQEVVKFSKADSLFEFLTLVTADLDLRVFEGHPARFEILTAEIDPTLEIEGRGGVTIIVWGEDDRPEHIYTCTYRGLFSDSVFAADQTKQRFYEQFHMWVNRGKLQQLFQFYLSNTNETELENSLTVIETVLIEMAKEGNLLLGNLDLISKTRQDIQLVMEEMTRFADEQMFVGYAERVKENIVKAKLCMFCKVLKEMMSRNVQNGLKSGGENGRTAVD